MLYASCVWAPATKKLGVRKMLDAVQRSIALEALRAHRTVSLHSVLIFSRLLAIDIRLEILVYFGDLLHPAHLPEIGYESVDDFDNGRLALVRPHIYTDGCRIEVKVGAALTEWRDGLVNIFGDSRSSLEVLTGPKIYHPLADEARCDISEIVAKGRTVRLFWVKAHAEIAINERANKLAGCAALTKKTAADYDRIPLSYDKRLVKAANLEECQERYAERSTGTITKCFFPFLTRSLNSLKLCLKSRKLLRDTVDSHITYLGRKNSQYCACDPTKEQDILHALKCHMFR
ncbi:hypothetical protein EVAR_45945_1 [Eumeta japonica]|uniref:RNase H type-1 domain-containing protein n=1 Tax=Eumeta variegata TaxID=151549 RepID=A0A4C1W8Q7_EUMVA|nr:hypothetical protein EVAR_45945_1 [Eumeta japonica]